MFTFALNVKRAYCRIIGRKSLCLKCVSYGYLWAQKGEELKHTQLGDWKTHSVIRARKNRM